MQLKRWDTKEVIFEMKCNSWEELLKGALKFKVSFYKADFRYSDFRGSNFRGSDFSDSDFRGSDFRGSDFRGSNFRGSNFSDSDFSDSDFRYSDFRYSDFRYSDFRYSDFSDSDFRGSKHQFKIGNMQDWHSMQLEEYHVVFNKKILAIGCKQYTIQEWKSFNDEEIARMDTNSLEWWDKWKEFIFKAIELCKDK